MLTSERIAEGYSALSDEDKYLVWHRLSPRIPKRFRAANLSDLDEALRQKIDVVLETLGTDKPRGIVMFGNPGSGKTHALYAIVKAITYGHFIELGGQESKTGGTAEQYAGQAVHYCESITHFDLMVQLRKYHEGKIDKPSAYFSPVVLLDDLGRSYDTEWNAAIFEEWIDARYRDCKPIIAGTNIAPSEMRKWLGYERAVDRLVGQDFALTHQLADNKHRKRTDASPGQGRPDKTKGEGL